MFACKIHTSGLLKLPPLSSFFQFHQAGVLCIKTQHVTVDRMDCPAAVIHGVLLCKYFKLNSGLIDWRELYVMNLSVARG